MARLWLTRSVLFDSILLIELSSLLEIFQLFRYLLRLSIRARPPRPRRAVDEGSGTGAVRDTLIVSLVVLCVHTVTGPLLSEVPNIEEMVKGAAKKIEDAGVMVLGVDPRASSHITLPLE